MQRREIRVTGIAHGHCTTPTDKVQRRRVDVELFIDGVFKSGVTIAVDNAAPSDEAIAQVAAHLLYRDTTTLGV